MVKDILTLWLVGMVVWFAIWSVIKIVGLLG